MKSPIVAEISTSLQRSRRAPFAAPTSSVALTALALLVASVATGHALAQDPNATVGQQQREGATNAEGTPVRITVDKSQYNLFNPAPDDQMRPFSTDRPGKTHSSLTVDAGHFQLESDFWNYTWDHFTRDRTTARAYSVVNPFLKLGVTNWAEVEIQVPTYNSLAIRSRAGQGSLRARGFGDLLVGGKISLFGNDGGDRALALYGLAKLPTAARGLGNNMVEYSLNAPYTVALPAKFSLTLEPGIGLLRNLNKQGYHADYQFLANLNRPVIGETVTAALEVCRGVHDRPQHPAPLHHRPFAAMAGHACASA